MLQRVRAAAAVLSEAEWRYPFAVWTSVVCVPVGLAAIVLGPHVSRAFSTAGYAGWLVYAWGAALAIGGGNVAGGIVRGRAGQERAGLFVLAAALAFYGTGVLIGLRLGGLVAGPLTIALAIACLRRARRVMAEARHHARHAAD